MSRGIDLTNLRYGKLTVIEQAPERRNGQLCWRCLCDCCNFVNVRSRDLRRGHTTSCGCWQKAVRDAGCNYRHGGKDTPEYRSWKHAKGRCYDVNEIGYKYWGGRGITMAPEWLHDFAAFLSRIGLKPTPKHSLDRIDVNGHYVPGNVRWATPLEQARNKRPVLPAQPTSPRPTPV